MKKAIEVKTSCERALIAVRLIKAGDIYNREFDNCFEMGDGQEVMDHLILMTSQDYILAVAVQKYALDLGTDESNPRLRKAVINSLNNPIMRLADEANQK